MQLGDGFYYGSWDLGQLRLGMMDLGFGTWDLIFGTSDDRLEIKVLGFDILHLG